MIKPHKRPEAGLTESQLIAGNYVDIYKVEGDAFRVLKDSAHCLSQINRYNGNTKSPIDVALHSCIVSALCAPEYKLEGLLHNLHESVVGDITQPMKASVACEAGKANVMKRIEFDWQTRARLTFDLPMNPTAAVKEADWLACAVIERRLYCDWHDDPYAWRGYHPADDRGLFNLLLNRILREQPLLWDALIMPENHHAEYSAWLFLRTYNELTESNVQIALPPELDF